MRYTLLRTMTTFDDKPVAESDGKIAQRKTAGAVP
jgi:hypothetical protein